MNFRRVRRELPRVEITALIDIVFLLVIFLMITTTFKKKEEVNPDKSENEKSPKHDIFLPESTAQILVEEDTNIEVWLDKDGKIFMK